MNENTESWQYEDDWPSPTAFVQERLQLMRARLSDSLREVLPAEEIPDEHQIGQPWDLDLEIIYFLAGGEKRVGRGERSILSPEQFVLSLQSVYPNRVDEVKKLTENNFEALRTRIESNNTIYAERVVESRRRHTKKLLNSWSPERVATFVTLAKLPVDQDFNTTIQSLHESILQNVDTAHPDDLLPTKDLFWELLSPVFCMTPGEMTDLASREATKGYVYLDSLLDIREGLEMSYNEAMRAARDLKVNKYSEQRVDLLEERIVVVQAKIWGRDSYA